MLSMQPYKGARDFFPNDMALRNYIFDVWRKVCTSFGFEEYDGPFLEPLELYASKTSDEIVNEQLYSFEDRGGRKVAIRPEMTPTVSRMVAQKINLQSPTPLKWFSISNFWRYEKPQKGRGREFFQLNLDIFGEDSVNADLEILLVNDAIMKAFGVKPDMFEVRVSNRHLINHFLSNELKLTTEQEKPVSKIIDKKAKVSDEVFKTLLADAGLNSGQIQKTFEILSYSLEDVSSLPALPKEARQLTELLALASSCGLKNVSFDPTIVRGFDYYSGNVFEAFDLTPGNSRSMFGGGRYDGLISMFIDKKVPAVGVAPGDITLMNFLEAWNLKPAFTNPTKLLVTIFPGDDGCFKKALEAAEELRKVINVETYLNSNTDLSKQFKYADRKKIPFVLVIGPEEATKGKYNLRNMSSQLDIKCKNLKEVEQKINGN